MSKLTTEKTEKQKRDGAIDDLKKALIDRDSEIEETRKQDFFKKHKGRNIEDMLIKKRYMDKIAEKAKK